MKGLVTFEELIGEPVRQIFLVVWPPQNERDICNIDISLAFEIEKELGSLYVISIDKDSLWEPCVSIEALPNHFFMGWEYGTRMSAWMRGECKDDIDYEYFQADGIANFPSITTGVIEKIELLLVEASPEPFGVKVCFEKNEIFVVSNADGSSVICESFGCAKNLLSFERLGRISTRTVRKRA